MSLDPLKNPMERLKSLPTATNWRKNPTDNQAYWSAQIQYYANDIVLSTVDEGAYMMTGNGATLADSETVVRAGNDPAVDGAGNWIALAPSGVGYANWQQPSLTLAPAGANVVTVTGGALVRPVAVGAGLSELWSVTLTTTFNIAAAAAGDALTFVFAAAVSGSSVSVTCPTNVGAAVNGLSATAIVRLLPTSTGATVAATWQGVTATSLTNSTITWVRIA
jgi:hypothetical protein